MPLASTARCFWRSRIPRRISNCSDRCAIAPAGAKTPSRAFALRLRPNQDFAGALETFCRERGISRAKLHGGVGSIIGARFADGRIVEPFATELAIGSGVIAPSAGGALEAQLDIAVVDYLGGLAEGRLVRGDNPVLMTMELVVRGVGRKAGSSLTLLAIALLRLAINAWGRKWPLTLRRSDV